MRPARLRPVDGREKCFQGVPQRPDLSITTGARVSPEARRVSPEARLLLQERELSEHVHAVVSGADVD